MQDLRCEETTKRMYPMGEGNVSGPGLHRRGGDRGNISSKDQCHMLPSFTPLRSKAPTGHHGLLGLHGGVARTNSWKRRRGVPHGAWSCSSQTWIPRRRSMPSLAAPGRDRKEKMKKENRHEMAAADSDKQSRETAGGSTCTPYRSPSSRTSSQCPNLAGWGKPGCAWW